MNITILKNLIDNIDTSTYNKLIFMILMIFIFSIIYTFFNNQDFAGWVNVNVRSFPEDIKKKIRMFYIFSNKYRTFMTKEEFISIPIIKINNELYILRKKIEGIDTKKNKQMMEILFETFSSNNKLHLDNFLDIPFKIELYKYNINNLNEIPYQIILTNKYAVRDYFDRLYYSVIIQTSIGFGDIFPANRRLRLVTMLQAFSTIFILFI